MKTIITLLFALLIFASCSSNKPYKYSVEEFETYDIPAKAQVSQRIVIKAPYTKESLDMMLNDFFDYSLEEKFKYRSEPTHIFIYVYESVEDILKDPGSWVAMISMTPNQKRKIQYKQH